jgi:hypothetical protein
MPSDPWIVEQEGAGLDDLLEEMEVVEEGLWAQVEERNAATEARTQTLSARDYDYRTFVDFSESIPKDECHAIVNYVRDWWGVPIIPKPYEDTRVWAEQWVFILDDTDWAEAVGKNVYGLNLTFPDFHNTYEDKSQYQWREYSYINWPKCNRAASAALGYKANPKFITDQSEGGGKQWEFLHRTGVTHVLRNDNTIWDNASAKITAWYSCHELTHGILRVGDEGHGMFVFKVPIQPLEILVYYTETGKGLLAEGAPEGSVKGFYGRYGKEKWE